MDDLVIDIGFLDDGQVDEVEELDNEQQRLAKYDIFNDDVKLRSLQPAWFMSTKILEVNASKPYLDKAIQAQIQQQIEYLYARGENYEKCAELTQTLLKFCKPLPITRKLLYDLMARCLIKLNRPKESIPFLENLVLLCRNNIEGYRMLTNVYMKIGQHQECFQAFVHLLKSTLDSPETWEQLANALWHFGYESWASISDQRCILLCESLSERYSSAKFSIPFYDSIRERVLQRTPSTSPPADHELPADLIHYLQNEADFGQIHDDIILDARTE